MELIKYFFGNVIPFAYNLHSITALRSNLKGNPVRVRNSPCCCNPARTKQFVCEPIWQI